MKFIEFFQGNGKTLSSKRLAFLASMPFALIGTIWICNKLIETGKAELAVDVWTWFFGFVSVLGGFVTSEVFKNLSNSKKKNNE